MFILSFALQNNFRAEKGRLLLASGVGLGADPQKVVRPSAYFFDAISAEMRAAAKEAHPSGFLPTRTLEFLKCFFFHAYCIPQGKTCLFFETVKGLHK